MTRSVEKNRSATRPTKNGDTRQAIETVLNAAPASVPEKCNVLVR
jgi:hypothetical protein